MIKTSPKNLWMFSIMILVIMLLYIFVYWPISPLGRQLHNLKLAREQAKIFEDKFKSDNRFKQIKFFEYTGFNGCLVVSGCVQEPEDIHFITNVIESMKCPVGIGYELGTSNKSVVFGWYDKGNKDPFWE